MRGHDRPGFVGAYCSEVPGPGSLLTLGQEEAHHLHVIRAEPGTVLRVTNGRGLLAQAVLRRLWRGGAELEIGESATVPSAPAVHLLVPVADRDRMLWLAEKAVELEVTSWRPVIWRRSRSVTGRGEGPGFTRRVTARMKSALTQSGSAWLPDMFPESILERALAAAPAGSRVLLHQHGVSGFPAAPVAPVVVAVGPEGGMEDAELAALHDAGFIPTRIAATVLRFETAGVAGLVLARAALTRGGDTSE